MYTNKAKKQLDASKASIPALLWAATKGILWSMITRVEYFLVWFVSYPILIFISFHLIQHFLKNPIKAGLNALAIMLLTGVTLFFSAYRLGTRFLAISHNSRLYNQTRYLIWFELIIYLIIDLFSLIILEIPLHMEILENKQTTLNFAVFMVLYFIVLLGTRSWFKKS